MNPTNLKVEFRLSTPVCLTYPFIFFDAVIAHLCWREKEGENYRKLPSKRVIDMSFELPIEKLRKGGKGGKWIYKASVSIFDRKEAYVTTIYKKFCEKYLNYNKIKRKKIDKSRGRFKDWRIQLVYIPARWVTFYVRGDAEYIERLLEGLPGLGKKTSIGFGAIKHFRIKEIKNDFSVVRNNVAMRPIPVEFVDKYSEIVQIAYKPPYWDKKNVGLCVPPFAMCSLKVD